MFAWLLTPVSAQSATYILEKGDLPILLVAPHGGSGNLSGAPVRRAQDSGDPHFSTKKDMLTSELTRSYSEEIHRVTGKKPSLLASQVHRKYCDLNRTEEWSASSPSGRLFHRDFHGALKEELDRLLERHGWALLLDIHGQSSEPHDLMIGVREGAVIGELSIRMLWEGGGLLETLRQAGFNVVPDRPDEKIRFGGGFIVRAYGADERVEAWQLEHGSALRFNPQRSRRFVELISGTLKRELELDR